jgi:hypothetical protein
MPRKQAKAPNNNPKQPQEPAKRGGYGDYIDKQFIINIGGGSTGSGNQPSGPGDIVTDPSDQPGGTAPGASRLN